MFAVELGLLRNNRSLVPTCQFAVAGSMVRPCSALVWELTPVGDCDVAMVPMLPAWLPRTSAAWAAPEA